jgi:hypothetical protein
VAFCRVRGHDESLDYEEMEISNNKFYKTVKNELFPFYQELY